MRPPLSIRERNMGTFTTCLIAVVAFLSWSTCTTPSVPSGTRITPSHFQFQTIVPPDDDPRGGGWRAVCIVATISQGVAAGLPVTSGTVCNFQVGVPFRNHRGPVSPSRAQREAANTANDVAYEILTTTHPVTGLVCLRFRNEYRLRLKQRIKGAEVSDCQTGVRIVHFP